MTVPRSFLRRAAKVGPHEVYVRSFMALQAINDGIWDWNLISGEVYCSARWKEILQYSDSQDADPLDAVLACLHPQDVQNVLEAIRDLIAGNSDRLLCTVRIRRMAINWVWGQLRGVCLRNGTEPQRMTLTVTDTTAQREAEIGLYASEEKFRALSEGSPDCISRFDRQGRFLFSSPCINRYMPVTAEDVIGKKVSDLPLQGDVDFYEKNIEQVFVTGLPIQAEARFLTSLAGEFIDDCQFLPEFDRAGNVVSVITLARDMTFLRQMEKNYQALFNSMADGFALFEHVAGSNGEALSYEAKDFSLVVMNPALGRMLWKDTPTTTGRSLAELMGKDASQWASCLSEVLKNGKGRPALHSLHSTEQSALFQVSVYSSEPRRVSCIVKDVTELHAAEQELRRNEALFTALYRLSRMDTVGDEEMVRFSLEQAVQFSGSELGYVYMHHRREGEPGGLYWSQAALEHYGVPSEPPRICCPPWPGGPQTQVGEEFKGEMVNTPVNTAAVFSNLAPVSRYMLVPLCEGGFYRFMVFYKILLYL